MSDNLWAREMGIDLNLLKGEDPFHPIQLANHRAIERRGESFWAYQRMIENLKYSPPAIKADTREKREKNVRKPAKVRRYVFTDSQLEIARRSLDAGGSV